MTGKHKTDTRKADPVDPKGAPGSVPASASNAPAVPLAGVPETPLPNTSGGTGDGPAVPSTDPYLTKASPNVETSADAAAPPAETKAVSGD